MSDDAKPFLATPAATLEQHVMNPTIAKSETEWWAASELARLRARVEVLENLRLVVLSETADAKTLDRDDAIATLQLLHRAALKEIAP